MSIMITEKRFLFTRNFPYFEIIMSIVLLFRELSANVAESDKTRQPPVGRAHFGMDFAYVAFRVKILLPSFDGKCLEGKRLPYLLMKHMAHSALQ